MREILFRGKATHGLNAGDWIYGYYVKDFWKPTSCGHGIIPIDEKRGGYCEVDPETVGQYTGLTDKNGKKIFEGDICQTKGFPLIDDKPFVVEWNRDECSFYWRDLLGTDEFNIGVSQNTNIIGNIHDNPELLKGGEE